MELETGTLPDSSGQGGRGHYSGSRQRSAAQGLSPRRGRKILAGKYLVKKKKTLATLLCHVIPVS